jgi:hypothetical protein
MDKVLIAYIRTEKTDADYVRAKANHAKNERTLYHENFVPVVKLKQPDGTAHALEQGDQGAMERVRTELQEAGYSGCTAQVRQACGGVGRGDRVAVKTGLRLGTIDTSQRGFRVIVRRLDI